MKIISNTLLFLLISVIIFNSNAFSAENIGSVGAVNQSAKGSLNSSNFHSLSIGEPIQNKERIETNSAGTTQIIFKDTSTMTVGRNSSVIVDEFIYNPNANLGTQSLAITKGALRFVGGQVSHVQGANIKTPTATVGIRGGIALVKLGMPQGTLILLQYGTLTVANTENTITISRPGFAVYVSASGEISEPFKAPTNITTSLTQQLASSSGQSGGLKGSAPTNSDTTQALNSAPPPSIIEGTGLAELNQFWTGNSIVQSGANAANQAAAANQAKTNELILNQVIQLDKKGELTHRPTTPGLPVPPGGITPQAGVPGIPPP
jgi:hypothetical protein